MITIKCIDMQKLPIGTHSGGEDRLAERDQKDSDQPAETTQRFQHISHDKIKVIFHLSLIISISHIISHISQSVISHCSRGVVSLCCSLRADAIVSSPLR